jgi:hypothetical protein
MWDDEPLLIDLLLTEDRDGIDWSFADAIGAAIIALADELRARPAMTRNDGRAWLKLEDLAGGVWFETIWAQACRIARHTPSTGGRPPGAARQRRRNPHVRVLAADRPLVASNS